MVNRFMWEDIEKGIHRSPKRIRCAIRFEGILKVRSKNINQKNKHKNLEFLAIETNETLKENYEIKISNLKTYKDIYNKTAIEKINKKWDCLKITNSNIKLVNKGFLFVDEISSDMFV